MADIDSILQRIRSGLAKHGRKSRVAERTGLDNAALSQVSNPEWNPTANTIRLLDAAVIDLGFAPPDGATEQLQDGPALPGRSCADDEGTKNG